MFSIVFYILLAPLTVSLLIAVSKTQPTVAPRRVTVRIDAHATRRRR
jgi:hypothetical protein